MEIITGELYKSGEKIFLNKKECLKYEENISNDTIQKELITFFIKEGFKKNDLRLSLTVKKRVYEFRFLDSDTFIYSKYFITNSLLHYTNEKAVENILIKLCNIEHFKIFYNHLLNIDKENNDNEK